VSHDDRRRHRRYPLRLGIQVHRGGEALAANVVNASASGCLLLMTVPLQQGEVLDVSIPEMMLPRARLKVVRCDPNPAGYMVATAFEQLLADEPSISQLSEKHEADPK
jgi:hypothetical protein